MPVPDADAPEPSTAANGLDEPVALPPSGEPVRRSLTPFSAASYETDAESHAGDVEQRADARSADSGEPKPVSPLRDPDFARQLVVRIIAGDRAAEDMLARESERGIRRVLRRAGLSQWDIAELTHDTLETAIAKVKRGELRDPAALSGFVCGIARGKASNLRRRIEGHPTTSDPAQLGSLVAEGEEPDGFVTREQGKELVWQVLRSMRPRDREVLIHFILHDEDKDEVCACVGISPARFHGILCRAKQRFHKLLLTTAAGKEMERRR